ncbi:hypothetical protein J3F84DRAFT_367170 [Trichoderma pleuroticola]
MVGQLQKPSALIHKAGFFLDIPTHSESSHHVACAFFVMASISEYWSSLISVLFFPLPPPATLHLLLGPFYRLFVAQRW